MSHNYIPRVEEANCAQTDPNLFFPENGDSKASKKALKICALCTISKDCLEYAVTNNEEDGIWGGATPNELKAMRKGELAMSVHLAKIASKRKELERKEKRDGSSNTNKI